MPYFLLKVSKCINSLNEKIGRATAWLILLLVLIVGFDVISRKLFTFTKVWILDLEWHLFALIFLLSAGYALKHEKHVRVDLFYARYSKKDKALTDFWGTLIFLIPWCFAVVYFAFRYAMDSFRMNEGAAEPGGLPARYLIKFSIVIGIFLLLLQAVSLLIESAFTIFSKNGEKPGEKLNDK